MLALGVPLTHPPPKKETRQGRLSVACQPSGFMTKSSRFVLPTVLKTWDSAPGRLVGVVSGGVAEAPAPGAGKGVPRALPIAQTKIRSGMRNLGFITSSLKSNRLLFHPFPETKGHAGMALS